MRIGTRTLKATAWLSGAIFIATLACIVCNSCSLDFGIESERYAIYVSGGAADFVDDELDHYGNVPEGGWCAVAFQISRASDEIIERQLPRFGTGFVGIPLWLPAAMCLAFGMPSVVTLRRRVRAIKNGACQRCGYLLTGLPPAAPCPECGRAKAAHG
ncbi:MAG: hypothetical protein SFY96_04310 [Planctomycetota bacterium]|nr:hypothetical protein [Planctomycetota bacterium]